MAQKKGYIGTVSPKTHSGDSDGTGGFGGFLGSGRFLALKFRFYKKFHRQNWLEIVGSKKFRPWISVSFPFFSSVFLGFPGKSKKFPDPGRFLHISYHTAEPYEKHSFKLDVFTACSVDLYGRFRKPVTKGCSENIFTKSTGAPGSMSRKKT